MGHLIDLKILFIFANLIALMIQMPKDHLQCLFLLTKQVNINYFLLMGGYVFSPVKMTSFILFDQYSKDDFIN